MNEKLVELIPNIHSRDEEPCLSQLLISNHYIQAATSTNTRKAYQSDIRHFEQWGGKLPASAEMIVLYLQSYASRLNPRTLSRRLTALKHWHIYQNFPDPTHHPAIGKMLAGITRLHGKPKEKAKSISPDQLLRIISILKKENTLAAHRDNALLQIGYFGAFRRSELVDIHHEHIQFSEEGIEILIPHSKTDQQHEGQYCAIPYGKGLLCPVSALVFWLELSGIHEGPIFRRILRNGEIELSALTPLSVNHILKKRAKACGFDFAAQLSSHSLRRGLATSASRVGAGLSAIMRQGRWKQVATVMEYIESSERFSENAATKVLTTIDDFPDN